jgi:hypothetical protein
MIPPSAGYNGNAAVWLHDQTSPLPITANVWYTYGMRKTTIYLPDELKKRLENLARTSGRPEAQVIRDAISTATSASTSPAPRIPLMKRGLGDPTIAENAEALLERFGR